MNRGEIKWRWSARDILRLEKPNSCSINCGTDTTLEASVQRHSLKAERPGETEASKSSVGREAQHSGSASFKLTNSCCDKQQDTWSNDGRQG